jgi:hypothetical protein
MAGRRATRIGTPGKHAQLDRAIPCAATNMKRLLLLAAVLVVAWFAGRALWFALASDDTRIRRLFAHEAAAFNDTATFSVLESFAPGYHDETLGVSLQVLRAGLVWAFQNRRDPASRRFLLRVALADDFPLAIDGDRATATLPLTLFEGLDERERAVWEVSVTADLERRDGEWRVVRSKHETTSGSPPGR